MEIDQERVIEIDLNKKYIIALEDNVNMRDMGEIRAKLQDFLASDQTFCLVHGLKFIKVESESVIQASA